MFTNFDFFPKKHIKNERNDKAMFCNEAKNYLRVFYKIVIIIVKK